MNPPDAAPMAEAESRLLSTARSTVRGVRLAAGFLTILPFLPAQPATADDVAASLRWFPLIGFALGAFLALENRLLNLWLPAAVAAVLTVLSLAIVTGGVHLDGLADTADALGAGSDRERALQIMRDSRIGSFGAIALFFVLAIKTTALAQMGPARATAALLIAPGIARWSMVAAGYGMKYLREKGAGSALLAARDRSGLIVASAITIAGAALAFSTHTAAAVAAALVATWFLRRFYLRWLDGVTGDLLGAAGEIAEALVLVMMSLKL
jgi:adenosylcobinamide-GDP ribazoletransferase